MKFTLTLLVFSSLLALNSCNWYEEETELRKVSCVQLGAYDYLESDWTDSICTTEICSIYTDIWKELFIKRNSMTEEYFDKHISIIASGSSPPEREGVIFFISYHLQNDWAIARGGDAFIIKIDEDEDDYPEIGLPKATFLTLEQIEAAIDHRGFNSWIHKAPKTGPLRYSSMNEALDTLIKAARVDTLCFTQVFLSLSIGTLTLEAYGIYEDEENSCITGTIDLITGQTYVKDGSCD